MLAKFQSVGVAASLLVVTNGGHGWTPDMSDFGVISPSQFEIVTQELAWWDKVL